MVYRKEKKQQFMIISSLHTIWSNIHNELSILDMYNYVFFWFFSLTPSFSELSQQPNRNWENRTVNKTKKLIPKEDQNKKKVKTLKLNNQYIHKYKPLSRKLSTHIPTWLYPFLIKPFKAETKLTRSETSKRSGF